MGLYLVVWGKAKDHLNKLTNQKSGATTTELPITAEPETTATAERCSSKAPPAWSLCESCRIMKKWKRRPIFHFVNFFNLIFVKTLIFSSASFSAEIYIYINVGVLFFNIKYVEKNGASGSLYDDVHNDHVILHIFCCVF